MRRTLTCTVTLPLPPPRANFEKPSTASYRRRNNHTVSRNKHRSGVNSAAVTRKFPRKKKQPAMLSSITVFGPSTDSARLYASIASLYRSATCNMHNHTSQSTASHGKPPDQGLAALSLDQTTVHHALVPASTRTLSHPTLHRLDGHVIALAQFPTVSARHCRPVKDIKAVISPLVLL
jgi:hypothetical protein